MAEESRPWPGTAVGDAGTYSDNDWDDVWERLFGSGLAPYNDRGVIRNWLNELEVTDPVVANRVDVDTGAALVHGKFYNNTAIVNVTAIPSATATNYREDLVCLQSNWVTQTIRIARHENPAENVAYPAPDQTDGVLWELPLAAVRIDDAGVITLITDLRRFVVDLMRGTREIRAIPRIKDGDPATLSTIGNHMLVLLAAGEDAYFEFTVPPDFKRLIDSYIVVGSAVNQTLDWLLDVDWGTCTQIFARHTDSTSGNGFVLTGGEFDCIYVSAAFDAYPVTPSDIVGCRFRNVASSAGDIRLFILVWRYE